jgi:formylglycine-generating enzyme required for sulfatase activity
LAVAGNIRVWSLDLYTQRGPAVSDGHAPAPIDPGEDPGYRVTRGGDWYGPPRLCRCANRGKDWPQVRVSILGFRLVRPA